jgi:hypothetical protein
LFVLSSSPPSLSCFRREVGWPTGVAQRSGSRGLLCQLGGGGGAKGLLALAGGRSQKRLEVSMYVVFWASTLGGADFSRFSKRGVYFDLCVVCFRAGRG